MTLSEDELEAAARRVCAARNDDPDRMNFSGNHGFVPRPHWHVVADEIKAWLQIGAAVYFVKEES